MSSRRPDVRPPGPGRPLLGGFRPAATFVARAVGFYALIYVLWLPFRAEYMRFVAAFAERLFRLLDHPPLVTSLEMTRDGRIAYYSFIYSLEEPMGFWNAANMHFYFVAALALVLASPLQGALRKARIAAWTVLLFVSISLAITVTYIKLDATARAHEVYGIVLFGDLEQEVLEWAARTLLMVGMLAFPAYLFFVAYLSQWMAPSRSDDEPPGRLRRDLRRLLDRTGRLRTALGAVSLATILIVGLAVLTRPEPDPLAYGDGWARIMRLNPSFPQAKLNVALALELDGELDRAIELYREALADAPELSGGHFNFANALQKKNRHEEALAAYRMVLDRRPDHAGAHRNSGFSLLVLKRRCEARRELEQAVELEPAYMNEAVFGETLIGLRAKCDDP